MANSLVLGGTSFRVGDQVKVHLKVLEGEKERTQIFSGQVLRIHGRGENKMFTVRKIAAGGIGVERILPAISPWITKVEVKKPGREPRSS